MRSPTPFRKSPTIRWKPCRRTCCVPNVWASPMPGSPKCGAWIPRRSAPVRELRQRQGVTPVFKKVDTCAAEFDMIRPISIRPTTKRMKRRRLRAAKSLFWAAAQTGSGRESSSITAAVTLRFRSEKTTSRPSW